MKRLVLVAAVLALAHLALWAVLSPAPGSGEFPPSYYRADVKAAPEGAAPNRTPD